jgi:hypothetical protein
MPFQQRTNTSCYLAIPTHGFTVVLSVFWGTPPAKPLNCKSVSNRLGARIRSAWAHHTGGTLWHSCDRIRLALLDIIKTSLSFHSQFHLPFVLIVHHHISRQQKTLLTRGKQGVEILNGSFTCSPFYPNWLRAFALYTPGIA